MRLHETTNMHALYLWLSLAHRLRQEQLHPGSAAAVCVPWSQPGTTSWPVRCAPCQPVPSYMNKHIVALLANQHAVQVPEWTL
jgi:hypothetical protein